jgi:flavin reductase (DIM6/NTAB) family NADH-FMN oxidoreductase RutF
MTATSIELMDPRTLRSAFGRFATGVAVITTADSEGRPFGVTVNSFTSVSLEPPLILFCILNSANNYRVWEQAQRFTVNILTERQKELSNAFARPHQNPWQHVDHFRSESGCPVLTASSAAIECTRHSHFPGGDHLIVVGQVQRIRSDSEEAPLLYYRGQYAQLDVYEPSR